MKWLVSSLKLFKYNIPDTLKYTEISRTRTNRHTFNCNHKTFSFFFYYKNSGFLESDEPGPSRYAKGWVFFINLLLRMHTDANIFLTLGCLLESNQLGLCP